MVEPYKPLYTVKEAGKVLMMNPNSVRELIHKGELPGLDLGMIKIRGSDLERFIESYPSTKSGGESSGKDVR